MDETQQQLVEELNITLRHALALRDQLAEYERVTPGLVNRVAFQPLSRDQVERWYAHTEVVRAGDRTATI